MNIDIATIQTRTSGIVHRAFVAPRNNEGTILLDDCPEGTLEVIECKSVAMAAKYMKVSESTVRRQIAQGASFYD